MLLKFVGGRKALAFYAALLVIFVLAWTGKASSEVLGALDTLSLIYIGGNVMKAKVTAQKGENKMMLNADYLTKAGGYRAVYRGSAISSTDWTDLTSADFYDVYAGSALAASLTFRSLQVVNRGSSSMFIKYRARTGAGDSTAYTEGVIQIEGGAEWSDDIILNAGPIKTIAFKKGASGDQVLFFVGFDKGN